MELLPNSPSLNSQIVSEYPVSTSFLGSILEKLNVKILCLDITGNIFYANNRFCERLGYSSSELLKLSIFDINPTTTVESWQNHWNEVEKKGSVSFKSVHKAKKGKFYDVEVFAQFFSNNGKSLICASINDISESSFYKNLLNHSQRMTQAGGWKLNLQDGSIIVTEQAFKIFESNDKDNFLPGNIIHRFEDSNTLKSLLSKAMRQGQPFDTVLKLKSKKTPKYIRCITDAEVKNNKVYKLIGTYQDVTSETIKTNELSTFKCILENTKDYITFVNDDYTYAYSNRAGLASIGLSLKEFLSKNVFDIYPNFSLKQAREIQEAVRKKGAYNFQLETSIHGEDFFFDSTGLRIEYKGKVVDCYITRDITDLKRIERNLINTLDELSLLKNKLEDENEYLQTEINQKLNLDNIICQSAVYQKVLNQVHLVAPTDTTVLITGESGTGKELLASAVHNNSLRELRPLIKVNCATLPKELIESELFGHKKGAFTGAISDKVGKFSLADGGTIFLDEIGEIPIDLQPKLLRVLQEGEFDQLGATETTKVDVRIIAATNRNLETMVKDGKFREDLYYRLNVFPIHNIPLRSRKEDIPLLAQFFLEKYSAKAGKSFKRLSKKTIDILMSYNFPGNIRELENLIERAVIIENGTTLKPGSWLPKTNIKLEFEDFKSLEETQRDYIVKVLNHTNWRVSGPKGAGRVLDMKDKTLFATMKRLGIERKITFK